MGGWGRKEREKEGAEMAHVIMSPFSVEPNKSAHSPDGLDY